MNRLLEQMEREHGEVEALRASALSRSDWREVRDWRKQSMIAKAAAAPQCYVSLFERGRARRVPREALRRILEVYMEIDRCRSKELSPTPRGSLEG